MGAALGAWGEVGGGTAAAQTALNQRVSVLCLHDCPASPARRKSPHLGFCPGKLREVGNRMEPGNGDPPAPQRWAESPSWCGPEGWGGASPTNTSPLFPHIFSPSSPGGAVTLGRGRREADGGDVYEAPSPPLRPSCCIKEIALLCICTPTFRVSALADGKPLYSRSSCM